MSFIRYKVTVMVQICFVFPSWITNEFLKIIEADLGLGSVCMYILLVLKIIFVNL